MTTDLYEVRADGTVFSVRLCRALKPLRTNGYLHVVLSVGGRKRREAIHVLVAERFLGPRPLGHVVNHKNGNRADNRAENLEWVTQSENVEHAYRTGLRTISDSHIARCAALGRSRRQTTPEVERQIRAASRGRRGDITALAKQFGLSRDVIRRVLQEGIT